MIEIHELLLDVWREACRHIEIGEFVEKVTPRIARDLPLRGLLVRRLDLQHGSVETVASSFEDDSPARLAGRSSCTAEELKQLTAWAFERRSHVAADSGKAVLPPVLRPVMPPAGGPPGCWQVGPLVGSDGPLGFLLFATGVPNVPSRNAHIFDALLEPFSVALENDRRLHELAALREAAEADRRSLLARLGRKDITAPIVGADAGLRPVMERVEVVGRSDVPVLILGETGTGKEVVARAIHNRSARRAGPFIRVNCGAIPHELIDSQLFGHERGSFTGAVAMHKGWFERADAGTLFLDEIGELPPAAQVRLLRVLQDGYIERVGGQKLIHVDVRVVAATHRDLAAMVRAGQFREDLWYRIAVFPIPLPPLRERRGDIPMLAHYFAEKAATRFGLPVVLPTLDDTDMLAAYPWPGNVRELAAVIDRAALLGNGKCLEIATALGTSLPAYVPRTWPDQGIWADIPPRSAAAPAAALPPGQLPTREASAPTVQRGTDPARRSLDEAMREHIERVLGETYGRIDGPFGAARRLEINPHTLRARMRKLGIDWRRFRQTEGARRRDETAEGR